MSAVFKSQFSIRALLSDASECPVEQLEVEIEDDCRDNKSPGSETTSQNSPNGQSAEDEPAEQEQEKPNYTYSALITMAIRGSPKQRLPLSGICEWILEHFPYFKDKTNFHNAIRHNLSVYDNFVRVPRALDDPGRGDYWAIDAAYGNVTIGENTGRLRFNNSNMAPNLLSSGHNLLSIGAAQMQPYSHHPMNGAVYGGIPHHGMAKAIYFPTPEEQMQAAHIHAQQEAILHQQRINQSMQNWNNYHHQQLIDQSLLGCHYMQNMYAQNVPI